MNLRLHANVKGCIEGCSIGLVLLDGKVPPPEFVADLCQSLNSLTVEEITVWDQRQGEYKPPYGTLLGFSGGHWSSNSQEMPERLGIYIGGPNLVLVIPTQAC